MIAVIVDAKSAKAWKNRRMLMLLASV